MVIPPVKMNRNGFKTLEEFQKKCTKFPTYVRFLDSPIACAAVRKGQVSLGHQFNYKNDRETKMWANTKNINPRDYVARISEIYSSLINNDNLVINVPTVQEFYDDVVVPYSDVKHKDAKGFKQRCKPLIDKYGSKNLSDFQKHWILSLLKDLAIRVSTPTQARYLGAWSKYFNVAISHDYTEKNPCKGIPKPKENPPRERVLSQAEVQALIEAAFSDGNPIHAYVILLCLFTGLRRGNIINIKLSWFNDDYSEVFLPDSKNNKPIHAALNVTAQKLIKLLLPYSDGTYLCPSMLSTQSEPKHTGKPIKCFARLLKLVQTKTGITDPFQCRDLRRTYASQMLRTNGDIRLCQQALNHSDVKVTERYAYHIDTKLLAASEKTASALLGGRSLDDFNPIMEK